MSRSYTVEKLQDTIDCLATHPGDVRKRIADAYSIFHRLRPNDFPPDLQQDWQWVLDQVTKFGPVTGWDDRILEGAVEHTMKRVQRRTGVKIANRIYDLYWKVSGNEKYT